MNLFDRVVVGSLPILPRSVIWLVAQRYVAGDDLSDALRRIAEYREQGFGTILDVLGEGEGSREAAKDAAAEYHRALEGLVGVDPDAPVSVKPTHLGMLVDEDLCRGLLGDLCVAAAEAGRRVRFEMEDASTVGQTLEVFSKLRFEHPNLGCVIQARLFRSPDDVTRLLEESSDLDVRLVKGIYLEPGDIAHVDHGAITEAYATLGRQLVEGGAHVCFATHDDRLADRCVGFAEQAGWCTGPATERRYEFQLLMGVRRREAARLRDAGHHVRIYVPYGSDWHAYSLRRLKHNPEVARHVMRAMLGLGG